MPKHIIKIGFVLSFFFLLSISFAQQSKLELSFIGYGKTYQNIIMTVGNSGETTISDVTIYVDSKLYKTIKGVSTLGSVFEIDLFLEEGEHLIEARTPEDAYDSVTVTAKKGEVPIPEKALEEENKTQPKQSLLEIIAQNILVIFAIFLTILLVIIWSQKRGKR